VLSPPSSCTVKVQFLVTLCLLREHPCYKSAIMSKTDTKLDEIIASLKCLNSEMSQLNSKFDKLESKVSVLQATTVAHEQSIVELQKEVKQLKEAGNTRDQEARANVVRIFNFPKLMTRLQIPTRYWPPRSMSVFSNLCSPLLRPRATWPRCPSSRP